MDPLLETSLLLCAGVIAGIVNTMAGGGSFLTLPALMALGLSPALANGTNRIAVTLQCAVGAREFHRTGHVDYMLVRRLAPPLVAGSLAGAWVASELDARRFEGAFGVLLISMGVLVAAKPRLALAPRSQRRRSVGLAFLVFVAIGFIGGFIQAGVGILLVAAMVSLLDVDVLAANAVKLLLVLLLTLPALVVFTLQGQVEPVPGLLLSVGNAAGAWLGVRMTLAVPTWLVLAGVALMAVLTGLMLLL